jgi:uncharacterized Zn finger protein (UPF0148 family)
VRRTVRTALLVVAAAALLAAAPPQPKTTLPDVEDEVMCPICGTALNLSAAPQADRERAFIRRQIAAGKTKDEIKDELVAQYGTQVLAEPPKSRSVCGAGAAQRGTVADRRGPAAAGRSNPRRPSASTPIWRGMTSDAPLTRAA